MDSFEKKSKITKSLARVIKKGRGDTITGMPSGTSLQNIQIL